MLDDFSRFILAWMLCTTMKVADVTETLDLALATSGLDLANAISRPRLLSDYELAIFQQNRPIAEVARCPT